jgi:hypothetical protein
MHLAAARGNKAVISTLLDLRANVDAMCMVNGKKNITPLFEACAFCQEGCAKLLIERNADVNAQNMNKTTCLHSVATRGDPVMAKLLVENKADIFAEKDGKRPLQLAVEKGGFPRSKLHLFTHRHIDDVILVAQLSAKAASDMLKDTKQTNENGSHVVHEAWQKTLRPDNPDGAVEILDKWCQLMQIAPRAAIELLETATVEPQVEDANRHALPRRARIYFGQDMSCRYETDRTWKCNAQSKSREDKYPEWHADFAEGTYRTKSDLRRSATHRFRRPFRDHLQRFYRRALTIGTKVEGIGAEIADCGAEYMDSQELVSVKILMVDIPNVLDEPNVLYALATTKRLGVFATMPAQAIITCAWKSVAKYFFIFNMIFKIVELMILLMWVCAPNKIGTNSFFIRSTWSVALAINARDVVTEFHEIIGYGLKLGNISQYINLRNFFDVIAIGTMFSLLAHSHSDLDVSKYPQHLCFISAYRWFMIISNVRVIRVVGHQVLPLVNSIAPLFGITTVIVLFFMTFFHAFMALELSSERSLRDNMSVFLGAFGLLLVGDGGGIETVLQLGGEENSTGNPWTVTLYVMSVIVFVVILLNLFIAVHGEAYSTAHEKTECCFFQERADHCLRCWLRPHWPPTICGKKICGLSHLAHPKTTANLLGCFCVAVAGLLITIKDWHPVYPSIVLLVAVFPADLLILQRPWETDETTERISQKGIVENCESDSRGVFESRGSERESRNHYLWICVRSEHDPTSIAPSESRGDGDLEDETKPKNNGSSLAVMRQMNARQVKVIRQAVSKDMRELQKTRVEERLDRLEDKMDRLLFHLGAPGTSLPLQRQWQEDVHPESLSSARGVPTGDSTTIERECSELVAFLQRAMLQKYFFALREQLGATTVADLFNLEEKDMQEVGFRKLEMKRLQSALEYYKEMHPEVLRHRERPSTCPPLLVSPRPPADPPLAPPPPVEPPSHYRDERPWTS